MLNCIEVSKHTVFGLSTNSALKVSRDFSTESYASFDSYYFINQFDQPNHLKVSKHHIGHMKYLYANIKSNLCFVRFLSV